MRSRIVRWGATLAALAATLALLGGMATSAAYAIGPTVASQVATYYANDGTDFLRSATPMNLADGAGTVSQTANVDGSVTVAISGVTGYGDSGFGVDAGTLGDLNGVLIQGTGDDFGLNLYFDVDGNAEYFTWTGDTYNNVGGDKYILGPSSVSDVLLVNGSTPFTSLNPGGGNYTLAQFKAGSAPGITASTPVRLWVGTCCGGTKSSTIQSIYISSGPITDYYVDGTFTALNAGGHIFGVDAFNVIQDAIDAAGAGATIHVAAGTYVEQLSITKNLTLLGEDAATTVVESPTTLSFCFSGKKPIICVNGADATIQELTVDGGIKGSGNSQFVGIAYYNAGGTVHNTTITGVRESPLSGSGNGVGLYANNADTTVRTLNVTGNNINDYGKNGMALAGTNLTANVTGNTVTGAGPTGLIAQNGIQIGFGAGGTVTGNTVSANAWTGTGIGTNDPATDLEADGAAGVLLYAPGAAVEIGTNTLTSNQFGVWSVGAPSINVHDNTITGLAHTGHAFPTGVAIWSADQWTDDFGFSEVGTAATVNDNTIATGDYGLLVRDYLAAAPAPSVTASGNTFTTNNIQVASTAGTVDIAASLSGNTFDRAVTVDHSSTLLPFIWSKIQDGVDAAASGDVVHVNAGTYIENLAISTSLELAGIDQATTIIKPAVSNPNCGGVGGPSLCAGASNVILVQANNVTIHGFTIDGDNPALTSTYNVDGANLDARNGIITNHNLGVYNGLEVHHVTVRNIYLRGMYASSGGSFSFHHNTVTNVQAEYASIAMFAYGGPGLFQNNTVSYANDAISANHSKGIQFLDNTVTHSGSGVHTDNAADGGGVADLIQGNTVSDCMTDGYGIFVFVPYVGPTVNDNTITSCKVGLSVWGQGAAVTTTFTNNTVNGGGLAGSIGARISTDLTDVYDAIYRDVSVSFTGNAITNNVIGVLLTQHASQTLDATFHTNQIYGNTAGVELGGTGGTLTNDFTHNWWGAQLGPDAPDNTYGTGDSVVAGIDYSPWCSNLACTTFVPPFNTTTTITSDLPDPSGSSEIFTINFTVANAFAGGPTPIGTVDITEGVTVLCNDIAVDLSGNGSCTSSFTGGVHLLTATFTPTSAADFSTSSDTEIHRAGTHLFADVPVLGKEWMEPWIDAFYYAGITTGCGASPLIYCPEDNVTRAEMAVFVLRSKHGGTYTPPAASHFFSDMPVAGKQWMEPWVDQYYREGLTTGCGANPLIYCPEQNVTRAEMAVFVLRATHGSSYQPPASTGVFTDVPVTGKEWMQPWIEQFYREGITTGCGAGPMYCPEASTTRAEMAVFLDRAFHFYP